MTTLLATARARRRWRTWLSASYITRVQPLITRLHWPIRPSSWLIRDPSFVLRLKGLFQRKILIPHERQLIVTCGKNRPPTPENLCAVEHTPRQKDDILAPCTLPAKQLQIAPGPTHLLREKKLLTSVGARIYIGTALRLAGVLTQFSRNSWTFFRMEPACERWFLSLHSKATVRDLFSLRCESANGL